jgi:hypothetical protein
MLYGPNGLTVIVGTPGEHVALGSDWGEVPNAQHIAAVGAQAPMVVSSPSQATPPAQAAAPAAIDVNALAEQVALRVADILAPLLPKRPGRPPNTERQESLDG